MLSRKYYQKFADILKDARISAEVYQEPAASAVVDDIEIDMIQLFESDDPNFDREKFERAASIQCLDL